MKGFLKFIISILVIAVIAYTLYFFLTNNAVYQEQYVSGETHISGEGAREELTENIINADDESQKEIENQTPNFSGEKTSGDASGNKENLDENVLEEKVADINLIETKNRLANLTKSLEANVGIDIVGTKNQDFMDSFDMEQMNVTIQVAGTMVYIIPTPEFVDNAQYHYDENGNLVLYICEFTGIGGEIRYYFENDNLLTQVDNVEEDVQLDYESAQEIVARAHMIYENYMK